MTDIQIQCFLLTCTTLNFTRTAEKLNYTPQAVSKLMTSLESELGAKLFTYLKNDRCLALTPAGQYYMDTLTKIRMQKAHAIDDIRGWYHWISGQFRLGITEWVDSSGRELTDALMTFVKENPKLNFTGISDNNENLYRDLVNGRLDAVIISSRQAPQSKEVGITPLAKEEVRLIVPEITCRNEDSIDSNCWGATFVERPMCGFGVSEFQQVTSKRLKRIGLYPKVVQMMPTVMSINASLMVTDSVTIGDIRFGHQIKLPRARFFELESEPPSLLCCMWSLRNENLRLNDFIKCLQKQFGDYTPDWEMYSPGDNLQEL